MQEESKKLSTFRSNLRYQLSENSRLQSKYNNVLFHNNVLSKELLAQRKINAQLADTVEGLSKQLKFFQDERTKEIAETPVVIESVSVPSSLVVPSISSVPSVPVEISSVVENLSTTVGECERECVSTLEPSPSNENLPKTEGWFKWIW